VRAYHDTVGKPTELREFGEREKSAILSILKTLILQRYGVWKKALCDMFPGMVQ
jgi:hypothetical protein